MPTQPNDGIQDAINGCVSTGLPSYYGQASSGAPINPADTTTIVCDSQITIIATVTVGDKAAYDSGSDTWYPLGRIWPSADPGDQILHNPAYDPYTGLRVGDNINLYIVHGSATIKVPGFVLFQETGSSNESGFLLHAIFQNPDLSEFHIILKGATRDDAELVANTAGIVLPEGEVDN
jgi:hypothetical protein